MKLSQWYVSMRHWCDEDDSRVPRQPRPIAAELRAALNMHFNKTSSWLGSVESVSASRPATGRGFSASDKQTVLTIIQSILQYKSHSPIHVHIHVAFLYATLYHTPFIHCLYFCSVSSPKTVMPGSQGSNHRPSGQWTTRSDSWATATSGCTWSSTVCFFPRRLHNLCDTDVKYQYHEHDHKKSLEGNDNCFYW